MSSPPVGPAQLLGAPGIVVVAALILLGTLTGCSGPSGSASASTASPSTPSSTAKATDKSTGKSTGKATGKATPTATATSDVAVSGVKGRSFDVGTIAKTKTQGGLTVLLLDRWTAKGVSDAKLATSGVPITPHTDTRFLDQTKGKTYAVPVNPSVPIVINTCDQSTDPPTMISTPVTLAAFLARPDRAQTVVIVRYDDSGRLIRLDTDPSC